MFNGKLAFTLPAFLKTWPGTGTMDGIRFLALAVRTNAAILIFLAYGSVVSAQEKKSLGKKFMRIVQQVVKSAKITYKEIKQDIDPISECHAT